jgi:hypothetical protein
MLTQYEGPNFGNEIKNATHVKNLLLADYTEYFTWFSSTTIKRFNQS